jgi:hypothetical protein
MANRTITEAFAVFKAVLPNQRWAVSAKSEGGDIVFSGWAHRLVRCQGSDAYQYVDALSRFKKNVAGINLLREHLLEAQTLGTRFRLVLASGANPEAEDALRRGEDASKIPVKFSAKTRFIGTLDSFDGDQFTLVFRAE